MKKIKRNLFDECASLVGFADLRDLPEKVRFNLDYGISIGVCLNHKIIENIKEGPNKQYQQEYLRVNQLLDKLAFLTGKLLRNKGYQAIALAATIKGISNYNQSTFLSHKTVATKAGLGWIGKSGLLITKSFGSALRLTTVLTNLELTTSKPVKNSICGSCRACVEACPANAVLGKNWHMGMPRNKIYDPFSCRNFIQEIVRKKNIEELICGKCIVSCPWIKKYIAKSKKISY